MDYIFYGVIAAVVILFLIILATGYVKASPDTAFIISGSVSYTHLTLPTT